MKLGTSKTKIIFKSMVVFIGKRREAGSDGLKAPSQKKQIIAELKVWTRDHFPLVKGPLLRRRGVKILDNL